ncbi:MAG: choice-of-anchor D domain-containing protein [Candidatus Kapaibacterium sp.]
MKKILYIIPLLIALSFNFALAQSIEIIGVYPYTYPEITAEFDAFDSEGKKLTDLNIGDVTVFEGGQERQVIEIDCPKNVTKFSLILTLDRSFSMEEFATPGVTRLAAAKQAAVNLIEELPAGRFECAVTTFSSGIQGSLILQKFTTDKDSLKRAVGDIELLGGTDYNAAFFGTVYGDLGIFDLVDEAKYKPINMFLTDGVHDSESWGQFRVNDVIDTSNKYNLTIYSMTLGMPMPPNLKSAVNNTQGSWYENLTSAQEIEQIYYDILERAQEVSNPAPCNITWIGGCNSGDLRLQLNVAGGAVDNLKYVMPQQVLPVLEGVVTNPGIINTPVGSNDTRQLRLTARNNRVQIDGYSSGSPAFVIYNWGGDPPPFVIEKGEFRDVFIRYSPTDTAYYQSNFTFETNACTTPVVAPWGGYIYADNMYAGESLVGQSVEKLIKGGICNLTGEVITIDAMNVATADAARFKILSPAPPITIPAGQCADVRVRFTPDRLGEHITKFEMFTGGSKYSSTITGIGIGNAGISSVKSVDMGTVRCDGDSRDTVISLNNTGLVELSISDIEITGDDAADFVLDPAPNPPVIIAAGNSNPLGIRFAPQSPGTKTATLIIHSNAENDPDYEINLSGIKEKIEITSLVDTLDFGYICPGVRAEIDTNIVVNSGTAVIAIYNDSDIPEIGGGPSGILGPQDERRGVVYFYSETEGQYSGNLIVTIDDCGNTLSIPVKAIVAESDFTADDIEIESNIGVTSNGSFMLRNENDFDIEITSQNNTLPQFTYISPALPIVVPARDSILVSYSFRPDEDKIYHNYLLLSGPRCNYTDSVAITGYPLSARADIVIGDHDGLVGEEIDVPIILENKNLFAESGAAHISTNISFDATMLEAVPPTPAGTVAGGISTISLIDIPVATTNDDETIYTLRLRVLDSPNASTPLSISNTTSDATVLFDEIDGSFSILSASADITVSAASAVPGEKFRLTFPITDHVRISESIHEGIEFDIRYNATLFEPIGDTPEGTVTSGERTITLSYDGPFPAASEEIQPSYEFRAMLGNAETTSVNIENARSKSGRIDFTATPGEFLLEGICDQGGLRLFDPFTAAALAAPGPNPASEGISINFKTSERGYTRIILVDSYGRTAAEIFDGIPEPGSHSEYFPTGNLSSGVYFIIMQTPTQNFRQSIIIQK